MQNMKKRIFSGIQPSGNLHLGNYLGAIKNWVKLQNEYDSIFCIVDLHAITIPQNPQELSQKTLEVAKLYLASGIDPEKSIVFIQSQVQEHAELMWLLNTITKNGDLMKMTQFKDKSKVIVLKKKLRGELVDRKVFSRKESLEYLLKEYLGTKTGLFNYP
ncbi:MAG: tryptophan--tRNA ligase, partial [Candidatus Moranbacteria bacterium]|nr:tryptophan--tRNA ligase [Candidatus Moranbacteria bacterium]